MGDARAVRACLTNATLPMDLDLLLDVLSKIVAGAAACACLPGPSQFTTFTHLTHPLDNNKC